MAELLEAIDIDQIAVGLPNRIHEVTAGQVIKAPDQIALVEDGVAWSNRDLDRLLPGSRMTPEELMSFIRFQLTSYKRPSEIITLDALTRHFNRQDTQAQARGVPVRGSASGAGRSTSQTTDLT